jgi:hypothetical protein
VGAEPQNGEGTVLKDIILDIKASEGGPKLSLSIVFNPGYLIAHDLAQPHGAVAVLCHPLTEFALSLAFIRADG